MATVTIDNVDYDTESLPQEALDQLQSIQFVDAEVTQLNARIAAMSTARNAYSAALQEIAKNAMRDNLGEFAAQPSSLRR